jgi:hypothetical protein
MPGRHHHGTWGNGACLLFGQGRFFIQMYPALPGAPWSEHRAAKGEFTCRDLQYSLDPAFPLWLYPSHNRTRGMEMTKWILAAVLAAASTGAFAQNSLYGGSGTGSNPNSHGVSGHVTGSGTYVPPHQATNPNSTQMDNYSTRGNVNPYTGTVGTRTPRY